MKIVLLLIFVATILVAHMKKLDTSENVTRLRGTMINPLLKEEDFRVLASWKANLIRWQLVWYGNDPATTANCSQFEAWLQTALKQFDSMLPVLRELGLNIILDLHTTPGGGPDQQVHYRLFTDKQFQDCLLSVWDTMANRYKNETQIIAYDILNEPDDRYLVPGLMSWRDLAIATIQHIRAIDLQELYQIHYPTLNLCRSIILFIQFICMNHMNSLFKISTPMSHLFIIQVL